MIWYKSIGTEALEVEFVAPTGVRSIQSATSHGPCNSETWRCAATQRKKKKKKKKNDFTFFRLSHSTHYASISS